MGEGYGLLSISVKPHIKKFIETHPFKKYQNIYYKNEDIGYFKWSWKLHTKFF